ncbi:MAG: response regulator [Planctomycetota bacterium]|jgi:DNA-binding NtrC family response regulator
MKKRTVLFVDDDEIILRSLERGLLDELYIQLFAKSGQEALEILKKEEVHVIVTDMRMPGMDGVELLKIVKETYPHIVMIVLSGFTDMSIFQTEFNQGEIFEFVPKPWELEIDLKKVVRNAIDHYNLQNECDTVKQKN